MPTMGYHALLVALEDERHHLLPDTSQAGLRRYALLGDYANHARNAIAEREAMAEEEMGLARAAVTASQMHRTHGHGGVASAPVPEKVCVPQLGLVGGDRPAKLFGDLAMAWLALTNALDALWQCAPQARNYPTPEVFAQAQAQHTRRMEILDALRAEIFAESQGIEAQGTGGEAP
jgi:hypothetical protein